MITAADRRAATLRAVRLTSARWPRAAAAVALGAGAVIAAGALLVTSGWLISRAAEQPEILLLGVAIVGVRFFGITRALLRYAERLASHDVAFRALTDLRRHFFARLVPLVPGAVPGRADLLSRFVGDADRMQDLYLRAVAPPMISLIAGLAAIAVAWLILPAAGLTMALALLLGTVLVPLLTAAVARRAARNQAEARAELSAGMVEVVEGAPEIAVYGREAEWESIVGRAGARLSRVLRRDALAGGLATGSSAAIAAGAAVALAAVGVAATSAGSLDGIMIASLVMLALATVELTGPLAQAAGSIEAIGDAAARLEQVTERPVPISVAPKPLPAPADGELRMSAVGFAYPGGAAVLEGCELTLRPGEAVALTGPSGSGKSTLGDLLVRFLDPGTGAITLGGVDLRELDPEQLRAQVRLAPQDAYLFATSIAANLRISRPGAGADELLAALEQVGLGRWVAGLERGLETDVGDAGAQVSGGQRQRLAMARAALAPSRFCIFDEPTSHLDPDGAAELLGRLSQLAHEDGRGVLVITHERDGLGAFDRVLELRGGRISATR